MILQIIGLALLACFIAYQFTPLCWVKDKLKLYNLPSYLGMLFYCPKCLGFWITLIYLQNLWLALIVSNLAYLIKFIHDLIEKEYRNDL
jgi:hypothetical protein